MELIELFLHNVINVEIYIQISFTNGISGKSYVVHASSVPLDPW